MATREGFSLAYRRDNLDVVVEVCGDLDLATAHILEQGLVDLIGDQGCRSIVVDLHRLEFIGSAGLSVLVSAMQLAQSRGAKVTLARVPPIARRVLELCGLLPIFRIRDDDSAAQWDHSHSAERGADSDR